MFTLSHPRENTNATRGIVGWRELAGRRTRTATRARSVQRLFFLLVLFFGSSAVVRGGLAIALSSGRLLSVSSWLFEGTSSLLRDLDDDERHIVVVVARLALAIAPWSSYIGNEKGNRG